MSIEEGRYREYTLSNGIRALHRQRKGKVAHLVLMINTGSRDEAPNESGLAHCIEHMIFKGTENRKAYHVLSCLENVGGDLNAFTTKEETCIHASFLKEHYKRSFDLFSDIVFHSVFPETELEKEKEVILDEIRSYRDSPAEEIYDVFEDVLFENHPLGRNILGTEEMVKNYARHHLTDFIARHYSTDRMVLSSIGDISFEEFKRLVDRYFSDKPCHHTPLCRAPFSPECRKERIYERESHLSHIIIGGIAPKYENPVRYPLVLMNNILGGPGMNSRLNLNIREKYGFAYTLESQYNAYSDIGLICVYMGIDPGSLHKASNLIYKELNKLRNTRLGTLQLYHGKQQLIGQLALGYESGMNELLSVSRTVLMGEPIEYVPEIIQKIEMVKADEVLEAANLVFDQDNLSTLVFKGRTNP